MNNRWRDDTGVVHIYDDVVFDSRSWCGRYWDSGYEVILAHPTCFSCIANEQRFYALPNVQVLKDFK